MSIRPLAALAVAAAAIVLPPLPGGESLINLETTIPNIHVLTS